MARPTLGINFYIWSHRLPNTRAARTIVTPTAPFTPTPTTHILTGAPFKQRTMQLKRRMQNAKCKTQTQSKNLPNAKWNQQLSECKKGSVALTHTHTHREMHTQAQAQIAPTTVKVTKWKQVKNVKIKRTRLKDSLCGFRKKHTRPFWLSFACWSRTYLASLFLNLRCKYPHI